jgi:hypothetical protein
VLTPHLLGERGQIGLGDLPSRQLSSAGGFTFAPPPERIRRLVIDRHEDAVGHARMQMHMVSERRSEAVQKGDEGSHLRYPAAVAGGTDATAPAARYRQGGPSMAPSFLVADGNAKGFHGCQARLSREATTKPWPYDVQRARPNPKRSPSRRSAAASGAASHRSRSSPEPPTPPQPQ